MWLKPEKRRESPCEVVEMDQLSPVQVCMLVKGSVVGGGGDDCEMTGHTNTHTPKPKPNKPIIQTRTSDEGVVGLLGQRVVEVARQELGRRGVALHEGRAEVHDDVGARLL